MISNIDYMKLVMLYENDKIEIDFVLCSCVWGVVLVGLVMFWSIIVFIICNIWIVS